MTTVEIIILVVTIGIVGLVFACGLIQKLTESKLKLGEQGARILTESSDRFWKGMGEAVKECVNIIYETNEKDRKAKEQIREELNKWE